MQSALVPWTDIALKKNNNNKPSSSQFSHCSKRGLIILHVYFVFLVFLLLLLLLCCFVLFCFFQENVILGSDYPFPLGERHPGKLIEDAYKDDLDLRVREQSHSVKFHRFLFAIDKTPPSSSLLKLPLIVIQKFCYHGNVTSHFSSLLTLLSLDYSGTSITFAKTRFGYIEVFFPYIIL